MQKIINFLKKYKKIFYILLYEIAISINIYLIYVFWENNILRYIGITSLTILFLIGAYLSFLHKKHKKILKRNKNA